MASRVSNFAALETREMTRDGVREGIENKLGNLDSFFVGTPLLSVNKQIRKFGLAIGTNHGSSLICLVWFLRFKCCFKFHLIASGRQVSDRTRARDDNRKGRVGKSDFISQ